MTRPAPQASYLRVHSGHCLPKAECRPRLEAPAPLSGVRAWLKYAVCLPALPLPAWVIGMSHRRGLRGLCLPLPLALLGVGESPSAFLASLCPVVGWFCREATSQGVCLGKVLAGLKSRGWGCRTKDSQKLELAGCGDTLSSYRKISDLHVILRDGHAFHQLLLDVVLGDPRGCHQISPQRLKTAGSTSGPRAWALSPCTHRDGSF